MQAHSSEKFSSELEALEHRIRENPLTAVAQAAAIGYAFRSLPLGLILKAALRLTIPALCVVGFWKACDHAESLRQILPGRGR